MAETLPSNSEPPEMERAFWALYREFFDKAERHRRWCITDDIPWNDINKNINPAVADVLESFCAVELYLPDYSSKILPVVRASKGRAWFYANWGYEESKHSLVLCDWLLRSGWRSDEQMIDLERMVFEREWNLPHDSRLGMLIYAMTQELATFLAYRNLRQVSEMGGGDPALAKILRYLATDERAHCEFFKDCLAIHLKHDREGTLREMRQVMNNFKMPAIGDLLDGSKQRLAKVKELKIMDEDIYYREVYLPILESLDVDRREMRNRVPTKKSDGASMKL